MIKKIKTIFLLFSALLVNYASYSQVRRSQAKNTQIPKTSSTQRQAIQSQNRASRSDESEFQEVMRLVRAAEYQQASTRLFQLSLSPKYADRRTQLRYLLGLMLYEMKMYQLSAFQFISVIREGNPQFLEDALEKLSLAADQLGDDALLNYAISRVKTDKFPAAHKDMLFFRIGEFQIRNKQYQEAVRSFSQVPSTSRFYDKAMYLRGYALASAGQPRAAAQAFGTLLEQKSNASFTDAARVAALMGQARSYYQMKEWDAAIEIYRQIPRDTMLWHDSLFEISWAMLRSGKFRSALSQFHTLHSPYYEQAYLPESLLLRSIVYLYICQYDEMDKVLTLFNKVYRPLFKDIESYLANNRNPTTYFNDVVRNQKRALAKTQNKSNIQKSSSILTSVTTLPTLVVEKVMKEGDFQRSYDYIKKLIEERRKINAMPASWRTSALGKYSRQTIERRLQRARAKAGRQVRAHMLSMKTELVDLFEQEGFIRYEMTNSKKESLKKKVAGKDLPQVQIDDDKERDFYIQNGYQYWTFRGEYWLDELGNYHYVGTQSCE